MARRNDKFRDDDAILSGGQKPSDIRPFTIEDEILVILKIFKAFTQHDTRVLGSYRMCRINKAHIREVLDQHDIPRATLFRLIKRVRKTFQSQR